MIWTADRRTMPIPARKLVRTASIGFMALLRCVENENVERDKKWICYFPLALRTTTAPTVELQILHYVIRSIDREWNC